MTNAFVAALQSLTDRMVRLIDCPEEIACKRFFGGAAAYVDNRIFMTLSPAGLAVKLPAEHRDRLLAQGATPLRYFPKAPIKKEYVVLPEPIADDDDALAALVEVSLRYVLASSNAAATSS